MILRRFMKHVTDQNWFAVGLDLLVVISGIFLGMQVTEWNEDRKEKLLEHAYLERLLTDTKHNESQIDRFAQAHERIFEQLLRVAAYVQSNKKDDELHAKLIKKGLSGGFLPDLVLRAATWDELVSSGKIDLIKNSDLKNALLNFSAQIERSIGQLNFSRQLYVEKSGNGLPYLMKRIDDTGKFHLSYNFNIVLGDQAFLNYLGDITRRQQLMMYFRQEELESVRTIKNLIRCELALESCTTGRDEK